MSVHLENLLHRKRHHKPPPPPAPPTPDAVVFMVPTVCFINNSNGAVADLEVTTALPDFEAQVAEFSKQWFTGAELFFAAAHPGDWIVSIEDQGTVPGALGFHEELNGVPTAHVFAGLSKASGVTWTSVASHELLEMLGDPRTNLAGVVDPNGDGKSGQIVMAEACDAVEQSIYLQGATEVSDFVYPSWWDATSSGPFDHLGLISKPFALEPGGSYIGLINFSSQTGWESEQARKASIAV